MNKLHTLIILLTFSAFNSYSQKQTTLKTKESEIFQPIEAGKIENGKYICNLFKWQIDIPSDFTITSKERADQLQEKGYNAMRESVPDAKNVKKESNHLIDFEKNKYNSFGASYDPLSGSIKQTLEEHKNFTGKLVGDTYLAKGVKYDMAESNLKLGKYDFYKILIHIYHPTNKELILTQELYGAYINNHLFSVNINFTDQNLGNILRDNFIRSFQ